MNSTFGYDIQTDGKEPFRKLSAACKVAFLGSAITGGYETLVSRQSPNFASAFMQGGRHVLLWTSVTTTFTAAVLFLTNVRKKDDAWNYFFAAHASSAVLYSITKKGPAAFGLAIWSSLAAALIKTAYLEGYTPFDTSKVITDGYRYGLNYENSPDVRSLEQN